MSSISNIRTAAFPRSQTEPEVAELGKGNKLEAGEGPQSVLQDLDKAGETFRLHRLTLPEPERLMVSGEMPLAPKLPNLVVNGPSASQRQDGVEPANVEDQITPFNGITKEIEQWLQFLRQSHGDLPRVKD